MDESVDTIFPPIDLVDDLLRYLVAIGCSVLLSPNAGNASLVQIGRIVGVHGRVDAHVLHVVKVLVLAKLIRRLSHHLAHVRCLETLHLVGHLAEGVVAALHAPELGRVPPIDSICK